MWDSWPPIASSTSPSAVVDASRADELVALRVAPELDRQTPGQVVADRSARSLQREQRRPDEDEGADQRRHGIARQAEDERLAADAERERLARLDRDAPEDLANAEVGRDTANEVVRPHRDAS